MNNKEKSFFAKKPNALTMEKLIKSKNFFDHAVFHSTQDNEFDNMIAIHNLDNSIEFLLKIIIKHLNITSKKDNQIDSSNLNELIKIINNYLKKFSTSLPYTSEIATIRRLRNLVQHEAILPTKEVKTCINHGQLFYRKCLKKFFNISIKEISYTTLIKQKDIKDFLLNCEKKLDNNMFLESIVESRNAFEYAMFIYAPKFHNIYLPPTLLELKDKYSYLFDYLKNIDLKIQLMELGIDMLKYERFQTYIEHIPYKYKEDGCGNTVLQREWNRDDAQFCYSFVTSTVMSLESNLPKPLYETKKCFVSNYSYSRSIDSIEIPKIFEEHSCTYINQDSSTTILFYSDKNTMEEIKRKIILHKIYKFISKSYRLDKVLQNYTEFIQITGLDIQLLLNKPATWKIIMSYKTIPFTLFSDNNEINIDNINTNLLIEKDYPIELSDIIQNFLEESGPLDTVEKAFSLDSLLQNVEKYARTNFISTTLINILSNI